MRQTPFSLLALAAFATVTPVAVIAFMGEQKVDFGGWAHVVGVGVGAGIATAAALALTIAGARQRDGRAVLVGCAFSVMAAMLVLHGITTPYVCVRRRTASSHSPAVSTLPVGGAILALSALPAVGRPGAVRPLLWLLSVSVVVILALGLAAMIEPTARAVRPRPAQPRGDCARLRRRRPVRAPLRAGRSAPSA